MLIEKVFMGVAFAMPIGPVTAEAIRRGLSEGFMGAFRIKFGAAIGDAIVLLAIYLGVSLIIKYASVCSILSLVASSGLIVLGCNNILSSFKKREEVILSPLNKTNSGLYFGLALALTNPFALAWWLSSLPNLMNQSNSLTFYENMLGSFPVILPILIGILLWDVFFCSLLEGGKRLLNPITIKLITALAGGSLVLFGIRFGYKALSDLQIIG